jgi:hypothetical protein
VIEGSVYREELFAGGQVRQDNAVCCPPCAGAVAREVPEANGMKVEGSRKLLHGTRKMQGLELTSPHERGEKQAAGTLMSPLPGPAAADISADPSSGMWITAMAAAIIEMERRKQEEEESTTATRLVLPIDTLWRGRLVENDLVYRQAFIIRSYEAGFDRIASIETISNLFQVKYCGFCLHKYHVLRLVISLLTLLEQKFKEVPTPNSWVFAYPI